MPPLREPLALQYITVRRIDSEDAAVPRGSPQGHTHVPVSVALPGKTGLVLFDCPLFMLQASSTFFANELEKMIEAAGASSVIDVSAVCDEEVFRIVCLYMEHFFGVATVFSSLSNEDPSASTPTLGAGSEEQQPTALEAPLNFGDLYHLTDWEVGFVWRELLLLPQLFQARVRLSKQPTMDELEEKMAQSLRMGQWVDALGAPAAASSSQQRSCIYFSVEEKKTILSQVLKVLEAATQLQIVPLQSLCAALTVNIITDLSEEELIQVLQCTQSASLTPERRSELSTKYPWAVKKEEGGKAKAQAVPAPPVFPVASQ